MNEPQVESVKRALGRLVDGRPRGVDRPESDLEALVERGEAAVDDVAVAAEFADVDGFGRLERAVRAADAGPRSAVVRRAVAVLEAVDAYRAVASDHFRRGHEGLMGGGRVHRDETT